MAHELDFKQDGTAAMAFAGDTPWHGLGQKMDAEAPLEIWRVQAGMDWEIKEASVEFASSVTGNMEAFAERKVLYRSDTGRPLSAVSASYNVVQPETVLEFYRDLIEAGGFKMRTAGVLFGGKKFWALADIGKSGKVLGNQFDGYLLLATACDGSMATVAQFTSIEVVCNNTLRVAVQNTNGSTKPRLSIPHSTVFDAHKVKMELGLAAGSWDSYMEDVRKLAERKINDQDALKWLIDTFGDSGVTVEDQKGGDAKIMKTIYELFTTAGKGCELEGRKGTLLGLVSATTEYYDYHTGHRTTDGRLDKTWFGETAAKKQQAWDNAIIMAS